MHASQDLLQDLSCNVKIVLGNLYFISTQLKIILIYDVGDISESSGHTLDYAWT